MANNGEVEFTPSQNWMRQMGFNAWGIQTSQFPARPAHFVLRANNGKLVFTQPNSAIAFSPGEGDEGGGGGGNKTDL